LTQPLFQSRLQHQDYQFQATVPAGIWRWTTRVDVSLGTPQYEVREVKSPYGTLRDMIPIPGPVIQAMADSIATVQQAFAPAIMLSPSGTLAFTLNQGQGVSTPQTITITNNGVFGSLLAATITTSAPWLQVTPANVTGLAFNESGTFNVTADSSALLAINSPYSGTVTVQDSSASNSPQTIPISVTVLPPATISVSPAALVFTVSSPLPPNPFPPVPSQTFTLSNTGPAGSQLTYLIQKLIGNSPWLTSFTPFMGNLASTQSQPVTVAVAPPPNTYPGTYTETLRVSGFSTNMIQDVSITLVVT
jgi:hypothetical protein